VPQKIEVTGKSTEALMVELCSQGNHLVDRTEEILEQVKETNGTVRLHESRLAILEATEKAENKPIWCNWRHMLILVIVISAFMTGSEWAKELLGIGL